MDEDYLHELRGVLTHLHSAGVILERMIAESDCPTCAKQENKSLDYAKKAHKSIQSIFDSVARREARQP